MLDDAHAFWLRAPGRGEIRPVALPEPGRGDVVVRTLRSGVSRGTETLVFRGGVPPSQYAAMRAPFQEGDFPGPVKYGYLNVGAVEQGPPELRGRTVFCLYPHQTAYVVPAGAVTVVPDDVPPARAVLAGTVETAVNALWDARSAGRRPRRRRRRRAWSAAASPGCSPGFPAVEVTLVDVDPSRAAVAAALGVGFARPDDAAGGRDLVVHTSATSAGLQLLARPARARGHGARPQLVRRRRGAALAGRRVPLRPPRRSAPARSGRCPRPAARAARPPTGSALALDLLRDPAFDALLTGESPLRRAARRDGAPGRGEPAGALPHHHLRRGVAACSA